MSMNGDWRLLLSDKVVFITGGAGWIARHIAKTCYEHGARIVLADLNLENMIHVKNEIFNSDNTDDRILLVELDVLNEETIKKGVQLTLNKWNTIDILINTFVSNQNIELFFLFL
jgi:3-hydroxybutyrate dehydrogenase